MTITASVPRNKQPGLPGYTYRYIYIGEGMRPLSDDCMQHDDAWTVARSS